MLVVVAVVEEMMLFLIFDITHGLLQLFLLLLLMLLLSGDGGEMEVPLLSLSMLLFWLVV